MTTPRFYRRLRFLVPATIVLLLVAFITSYQLYERIKALDSSREITLLPPDAVTITHQTQFVTVTNGAFFDRTRRYLNWQVAKVRGSQFPPLSAEITLGGLANLYRSVDTLNAGIMVSWEFFDLTARFPTNCVLTNAQTSLRAFRPALQQVLRYNHVVGVREWPLLRLVKSEWVHTNFTGNLALPWSEPVRSQTNQTAAAAGSHR